MTKILEIVKYPDMRLFLKAAPVIDINSHITELIKNMKFTMLVNRGVGLAAPQVGENLKIIIVMDKDDIITMINPEVVNFVCYDVIDEEGCLSCPGVRVKVKRRSGIHISYYNEEMKITDREFFGLSARIVQHEMDHLDGKLIITK